jgi:hypothetical protein
VAQAFDSTDPATTQLMPYLAADGHEEAWRAFVARYRPRILRWCRRLQADDAEEVDSRVLLGGAVVAHRCAQSSHRRQTDRRALSGLPGAAMHAFPANVRFFLVVSSVTEVVPTAGSEDDCHTVSASQ